MIINAEQTYLQVAIDTLTEQLQIKYGSCEPIIYNTFQNYLRSTRERIEYEMRKFKELKIPFAIKFVRGAYMNEENEFAREKGYPSPICDNYEATSENIHNNIKLTLEHMKKGCEVHKKIF